MAITLRRLAVCFRSAAATQRWVRTAAAETATKDGNLFAALCTVRDSPEPSFPDTLDRWVKDGKPIKRYDIISFVNVLRKYKRFHDAIQLYEWMEKNNIRMNNADHAVLIDLLAKTEGIESAEKYFNSLQESAKTQRTFGSLLSCYCREKMLDKALELFEELKVRNCASTLNYNNVMGLHLSVEQPERVPSLVQEMEEKNIGADLYTYNQLMTSYASLNDLDAVESVLKKMEASGVKLDWVIYSNLATIYLNAESLDKVEQTLHKMESLGNLNDREAYHTLISLYARSSNLSGVNRVWESLRKSSLKPANISWVFMLQALSKLGDVDTLVARFREWESEFSKYDVKVANVILESYLKRDMIEEANAIYESILSNGAEPNLKTSELLAGFHVGKGQVDLALKHLEIGSSKVNAEKLPSNFPSEEMVGRFLLLFQEVYDEDQAARFCEIMKKIGRLDSKIHDLLLHANKSTANETELQA